MVFGFFLSVHVSQQFPLMTNYYMVNNIYVNIIKVLYGESYNTFDHELNMFLWAGAYSYNSLDAQCSYCLNVAFTCGLLIRLKRSKQFSD